MTQTLVQYQGGESRTEAGRAVDYMLAIVDGHELYAEAEPGSTEAATYEQLKKAILEQAVSLGISSDCLRFWYDE